MNDHIEKLIKHFNLLEHPEGGYYTDTNMDTTITSNNKGVYSEFLDIDGPAHKYYTRLLLTQYMVLFQ